MQILQPIIEPFFKTFGVELFIKRLDLIDPEVSGNKWYKLKYNLEAARQQGKTTLLTFGGAFSNHIYAVAAAGKRHGFQTIGYIRGEKRLPLNPTLQFAKANGMILRFISRSAYRQKTNPNFLKELQHLHPTAYILPEGGTNTLAVKGCAEIVAAPEQSFDYYAVPCGSGGTMAGIIVGVAGKGEVLGFSTLRGGSFLQSTIHDLLGQTSASASQLTNWQICSEYHCGGFAKFTPPLIQFINRFKVQHDIPLDPIYTGKMLFGLYDLIQKGFFKHNTTIVAMHTGGLQGIEGFNQRFGKLL